MEYDKSVNERQNVNFKVPIKDDLFLHMYLY